MKCRNPGAPQRHTLANELRKHQRVEQYYGKVALLDTWEAQPEEVLIANHEYIIELRQTVRQVRAYLLHRADATVSI